MIELRKYIESGDIDAIRILLDEYENELYVDPNTPLEHPPVAISFGTHNVSGNIYPTPIATYGNLVVIQAPPKSMKTYFTSLLVGAFMEGGTTLGYGSMRGHSDGRDVYHFDTEQGKFHAQRVFSRTHRMARRPEKGYYPYALRSLDHLERREFIKYCLFDKAESVGMFILDGIADLVSDVNNIEESNAIVQDVMRWTQQLNCVAICIIHQNYGSDKPTGHLGSALQKKAETMIKLERDGMMAKVSAKDARNVPFEEFVFKINQHGYPEVVPNVMNQI